VAPHSEDNHLMVRVRDGEIRCLAPLFERYHKQLYNYFLRLTQNESTSEDFVQEVFFRILKYKHTFRGDGQFLTWIYHLARNVRIDHSKKWGSEFTYDSDSHEPQSPDSNPAEAAERNQDLHLLEKALNKLSVEKKEVLIMSRYQDLKYEVISEILGISVENVKVRVHRAMHELRTHFHQLSGEKQ